MCFLGVHRHFSTLSHTFLTAIAETALACCKRTTAAGRPTDATDAVYSGKFGLGPGQTLTESSHFFRSSWLYATSVVSPLNSRCELRGSTTARSRRCPTSTTLPTDGSDSGTPVARYVFVFTLCKLVRLATNVKARIPWSESTCTQTKQRANASPS